jgi:hypothetical protein
MFNTGPLHTTAREQSHSQQARTVGVLGGVVVDAEEQQLRLQVLVQRLAALGLVHVRGRLGQVRQSGGAVGAGLRQLAHKTCGRLSIIGG